MKVLNFIAIKKASIMALLFNFYFFLILCVADCGGAEYAREKGIPVIVFPKRKDTQESFSGEDLVIALRLELFILLIVVIQ